MIAKVRRTRGRQELMTVEEVARWFRIARPKVYRLIYDNVIAGKKIGGDWRVITESVELISYPIPKEWWGEE